MLIDDLVEMTMKVDQLAEHPEVCYSVHSDDAVLDLLEELLEVITAVKRVKDQVAILSVQVPHIGNLEVFVVVPKKEHILSERNDLQDRPGFELVEDVQNARVDHFEPFQKLKQSPFF